MGYEKSFIEVQFPVSKISKESYKERKAGSSQTLTKIGKWWGRKPLILVRAVILGCILPSTDDLRKDREVFLNLLGIDESGLKNRKNKSIPIKYIFDKCDIKEKEYYFIKNECTYIPKLKSNINKNEKEYLQNLIFNRMSYDEKLKYCERIEDIDINKIINWNLVNNHLGINVDDINKLVNTIGNNKFNRNIKLGDCFAGGGSIPFEASRLGCDVIASDLNPISGVINWANLNIIGGDINLKRKLNLFQQKVFYEAEKIVNDLGIEINEKGWRANAYLYCNETICPECGYKIPLAPSWVIGSGSKVVAQLVKNEKELCYDINIKENCTNEDIENAKNKGTIKNSKMICLNCKNQTPITVLRKDGYEDGLRQWSKNEYISRHGDIYSERLYCIRYDEIFEDKNGKLKTKRHYVQPSKFDFEREDKVKNQLDLNFEKWQSNGYIPNVEIEEGYNTNQILRERGWRYWSQLFNYRQLFINGLLMSLIDKYANTKEEIVIGILGINRCCDWNSKLCMWHTGSGSMGREGVQNTFFNQALNTLYNYGVRSLNGLKNNIWNIDINSEELNGFKKIIVEDARSINEDADIWITDPPYADAVNYHELSEFFLAWDKYLIKKAFPSWYTDSKRILAVKGKGEDFNKSMIDIYKNLSEYTTENGIQVVMFTHQDVKVWAELAMILWSAGLQVTAAWNIATETESGGLKNGNYIKGTVLLVLRKQTSEERAYLDELYPEIEEEVKNQIDSMRELDDKEDPNFSDPDYLLAAYAASLKVLTSYKSIEDIDVKYELSKNRNDKEETPIQKIINEAKKIAYDYLIPVDFDNYLWKALKPVERFYLKGLDFEMNNMCKLSAYQELAKGFGVNEYNEMLGSKKANSARLKTPKEFAMKNINDNTEFGQSLLRNVLASIYISLKEEDSNKGLNWIKTQVNDYWNNRGMLVEILNYLSKIERIDSMKHWKEYAHEAYILKNLVENDSI
ncbi:anti-phage-associated DUF1156 domain-containing protein [Clostridium perfringens]|uniref:anti-phage-associated DUF1156 domain-containing protein n=1 Tax=Clostridium perfringens TaxID=1502 RepID=UPI002AC549BB|nr:anti-phage-associated DUF1156 domain-containing protein [Clostridium perfringens]MDM0839861.1 DUF1156 domain-containing protein [Clostridium perfringens]MDZ5019752.1 DUF1156 domain-containing protein [Clostridium perfringens]